MITKSLILYGPNLNSNPNRKKIFEILIPRLSFFWKNNVFLREDMDKGLTVPKWVLINWPKIPQMPQNTKVWDVNEKRLHWASVIPGPGH